MTCNVMSNGYENRSLEVQGGREKKLLQLQNQWNFHKLFFPVMKTKLFNFDFHLEAWE